MKYRFLIGLLLLAAVESPAMTTSAHLENRVGLSAGLIGDPFPNPLGVALAYNAADFLRLGAVYGAGYASGLGWGHSLSLGPTLLVPGWRLTPTAGVHWATTFGANSPKYGFGGDEHLYFTAGLDWQARSGFNVTAGYNIPLRGRVGGTPYLRVGWFF